MLGFLLLLFQHNCCRYELFVHKHRLLSRCCNKYTAVFRSVIHGPEDTIYLCMEVWPLHAAAYGPCHKLCVCVYIYKTQNTILILYQKSDFINLLFQFGERFCHHKPSWPNQANTESFGRWFCILSKSEHTQRWSYRLGSSSNWSWKGLISLFLSLYSHAYM